MSVTSLYVPFKATLEPIVRPGEYIAYWYRGSWRYFSVKNVEPLPAYIKDLGSVSANTTTDKTKLDMLEVEDDELIQARIYPLEPVKVNVYQPQGSPHYQTKTAGFYLVGQPMDLAFATGGISASPTTVFSVPSGMDFRLKLLMIDNTNSTSSATITIKDNTTTLLTIPVSASSSKTVDLTSTGGVKVLNSLVVESTLTDGTVYVNVEGTFEFDGIAPGANEIYVYKDNLPYVEVTNPLPVTLSSVRLLITGFKYKVEPAMVRPEIRFTHVGGEPV